ncbi:MAG: hypothetical protein R2784_12725 [Saprospiraceae bacterium]
MASTLGYVATIVGLGAILRNLKKSGERRRLPRHFKKFGTVNAPIAMSICGLGGSDTSLFRCSIYHFHTHLICLVSANRKSLLLYAIPLLAGLAVAHTFIPPTPGPVAVADILNADLGMSHPANYNWIRYYLKSCSMVWKIHWEIEYLLHPNLTALKMKK